MTLELQEKNTHHNESQYSQQGEGKYDSMVTHKGEVQPRAFRVNFLTIHGEDPLGWLYKVNKFFNLHNTHPQHKMRLVFFPHGGQDPGVVPKLG